MLGRLAVDHLVPPAVPALFPVHVLAGAPDDQDRSHLGALLQRLVHVGFQCGLRPAPVAAVGGDHDAGITIEDPTGQASSAEKPPKTTEWGAPIRAQASMATTASGIIGM